MTDRTSLERSPGRTLRLPIWSDNRQESTKISRLAAIHLIRGPEFRSRPIQGWPTAATLKKGRLRQLSWDEQALCNRRPRESEELATPTSEVKGSYRCALALKIETRLSQSSAVAVPQSKTAHGHFRLLFCSQLSRGARRTVYRIAGLSQIAHRVVSPSLQRGEHIGDVLGLDGRRVGTADAGVHHIGVAAKPNRSGLQDGDAIMRSIGEFDGPRLPVDLQIMPIGSPARDLVDVLKVFLVIAHVTMNVAPPRWRTGRKDFVRVKRQDICFDRQSPGGGADHVQRQVAGIAPRPGRSFRESEPVSLQTFAALRKSNAGCRARHLGEFILLHAISTEIRISRVSLPGISHVRRLDRGSLRHNDDLGNLEPGLLGAGAADRHDHRCRDDGAHMAGDRSHGCPSPMTEADVGIVRCGSS